jgi:LPS export ABC transporter protein LptC
MALSAGCSFDYGQASIKEKISEEIPNSILFNFEHTVVENGKPAFRLNAERAEFFDGRKETRLANVSFVEYDSRTGEAISAGRSAQAVFYAETEDAELSGDISVYSKRSEAGLSGGYLYWDNAKKTLEGRRDRLITITRDDGTEIRGEGFTADARRRSMSFSGRAEGTIVSAGAPSDSPEPKSSPLPVSAADEPVSVEPGSVELTAP